ncbi:MAG: NAD(P)H-quinone oxidoreductase [Nevskia sp.]|nr:NAD(P)H-quinone oxidoreductase [Nevskia sp.]
MSLPASMRYIAATGPGGPEVMAVQTGPLPQPAAGQVLVRVQAAGVNRPDVAQREGKYPPPPDASPVLGLEIAGEVVALGAGVAAPAVGSKVCALVHGGGYAEYCTVAAAHCLPWPQGYDAVRAAALPETYFTVWANVFQLGRLGRGESLLVHGGSSGIGVTAIQLAHEFAGTVYATAGSAEKCAACETLGAARAINYRSEDFEAAIREATGGRGVDQVLDMVGAPYFQKNLRCLAMDGRLVEIAAQQGSKVEFDIFGVMRRRIVITGSMLRPRSPAEKAAIAADLRKTVWPVLDAGRCAPVIHQVFALEQVVQAHALMESSAHIGKIMLTVAA